MKTQINRRTFLKTTTAGLTALSASRVFGANERINVGLIGFGLIGRFHLAALKEQAGQPSEACAHLRKALELCRSTD